MIHSCVVRTFVSTPCQHPSTILMMIREQATNMCFAQFPLNSSSNHPPSHHPLTHIGFEWPFPFDSLHMACICLASDDDYLHSIVLWNENINTRFQLFLIMKHLCWAWRRNTNKCELSWRSSKHSPRFSFSLSRANDDEIHGKLFSSKNTVSCCLEDEAKNVRAAFGNSDCLQRWIMQLIWRNCENISLTTSKVKQSCFDKEDASDKAWLATSCKFDCYAIFCLLAHHFPARWICDKSSRVGRSRNVIRSPELDSIPAQILTALPVW